MRLQPPHEGSRERVGESGFRLLVEQSLAGIFLMRQGRFIYVNPKMSEIFGLSSDALYRQPAHEFVMPEDRHLLRPKSFRFMMESADARRFTVRLLPKGGESARSIEIQCSRIQLEDRPAFAGTMVDTTEIKRLEEELRVQGSLLDNAQHAIVASHLDHRITYWNRGAERLYGWTSEEAIGHSALKLMDDETATFAERHRQTLDKGEWIGELRQTAKDGAEVIVASHWVLGCDSSGNPRSILTINENITERRRAQAALRESEARLKSIIDHEPECVKVVALDRTLLEMNPAGLAMIEAGRREEAIGKDVLSLIHPEDQKTFLDLHQAAIGGKNAVGEFRIVGRRGALRHMESHSVPLKDDAGKVLSVLSVTRDVSEQKKVEAVYREGEKRLRSAMEASLDALYVQECARDASGQIIDFRFTEVNRKGAELLNRRRKDLLGHRLCELFPQARKNGFFEKFVKVVETGRPLVEEFASDSPDVRASWLHQQVVRLGDGVAVTARDITERKLAEEALRRLPRQIIQAQEEERRRIAQELHDGAGQLLASVRFRLQGAEARVAASDPRLRDLLAKAREALEQAAVVTRATAHRLHPTPLSDFGLTKTLRAMRKEFQQRTGAFLRVAVPRKTDERLAPEIQMQLYRIVQEALTNVERHAKARSVTIRVSIQRRKVRLEVTDDGVGMALRSAKTRRRIAAGLGLASMQERAKILGGHFHLDTAKRKGLRALVEIPLMPLERNRPNA